MKWHFICRLCVSVRFPCARSFYSMPPSHRRARASHNYKINTLWKCSRTTVAAASACRTQQQKTKLSECVDMELRETIHHNMLARVFVAPVRQHNMRTAAQARAPPNAFYGFGCSCCTLGCWCPGVSLYTSAFVCVLWCTCEYVCAFRN